MDYPEPTKEPHLTISPPAWPAWRTLRWHLSSSKYHEYGRLPWIRLSLFFAFLRRGVYVRRPFHGNAYQMLREGRLEIGQRSVIEAGVTVQSTSGRIRLGQRVYLSRGVTVGAVELVEIGDFALVAPGCYITDADHRFDDPVLPVPDQGMRFKGPTILEDNVWLGANVVVTGGVRIGARSVIGANSVVTRDIPAFSVASGIPAKVLASHKPDDAGSGLSNFDTAPLAGTP